MSRKYDKLKSLLLELFQLDQPDLDFGLYRVMRARSAEVTQFLDHDLLPQVRAAFAHYQSADRVELEQELAKVVASVEAAGLAPEDSPKVQELRERLKSQTIDVAQLEGEVYEHLYSFFRRYYSDGDFLAKRVYKAGVYAIPYEGEEVTLHWANKDQYYIKTSEYLRDYAFRLRPENEAEPMRVHFRLVDAAEGEHGNVKAAEGKERVFVLAASKPDAAGEADSAFLGEEAGESGSELVIRFEYRPATAADWPDEQRSGKSKPPAQKDLTSIAASRVLAALKAQPGLARWTLELGRTHVKADGERADYSRLEAHLRRYTARNTSDYFIHKDLGGFLRRELDFYLKNEVMHLDDVENETVPRVEQYLSKIKVIRKIASKLIDFLAQLEEFQKKLWLKKKFVVETQYCITVGNIPEEFYPEIAANEAQREEWVRLCAIDEISAEPGTLLAAGKPGYSVPLRPDFLKAHPTLVVDTCHFDTTFIARLLGALGNIDELTVATLFDSENTQAISLMRARYFNSIDFCYLDPPYNTGNDGFVYKDNYQHSAWLSMIQRCVEESWKLVSDSGRMFFSIDDREVYRLSMMNSEIISTAQFLGSITWEKRTKSQNTETSKRMLQSKVEYILPYSKSSDRQEFALEHIGERDYPGKDDLGPFRLARIEEMSAEGTRGRSTMVFPILGTMPRPGKQWQIGRELARRKQDRGDIIVIENALFSKVRPHEEESDRFRPFWSHFFDKDTYGTAESGLDVVDKQLGFGKEFSTVKPLLLMRKLLFHSTDYRSLALDCFAGSGTTGHAVINLNREDGGSRGFILIEMGAQFDSVLVPRLKKVAFAAEWKDGKPKRLATPEESERSPRIIKVVRLESYEDTLNNLDVRRSPGQQQLLDDPESGESGGLREQYLLRYLLDVETRGSQSLLNVRAFSDPTAYQLKVKRPGSDESRLVNIDLLETLNWLLGLRVHAIAAPQTFDASFERDSEGRLTLAGRLRQATDGPWWFRRVEGNDPEGRKALIVWRKLTGDPERDNLVLDVWMKKRLKISTRDFEFDLIYVNGGNNLENLKTPDDRWKVRLIEEEFHRLMFDTEGS